MSQVTSTVSNEKLPQLQNFLNALGMEDKREENMLSKPLYNTNISKSVKDTANAFFQKYLSWEYFSNELEFE